MDQAPCKHGNHGQNQGRGWNGNAPVPGNGAEGRKQGRFPLRRDGRGDCFRRNSAQEPESFSRKGLHVMWVSRGIADGLAQFEGRRAGFLEMQVQASGAPDQFPELLAASPLPGAPAGPPGTGTARPGWGRFPRSGEAPRSGCPLQRRRTGSAGEWPEEGEFMAGIEVGIDFRPEL